MEVHLWRLPPRREKLVSLGDEPSSTFIYGQHRNKLTSVARTNKSTSEVSWSKARKYIRFGSVSAKYENESGLSAGNFGTKKGTYKDSGYTQIFNSGIEAEGAAGIQHNKRMLPRNPNPYSKKRKSEIDQGRRYEPGSPPPVILAWKRAFGSQRSANPHS